GFAKEPALDTVLAAARQTPPPVAEGDAPTPARKQAPPPRRRATQAPAPAPAPTPKPGFFNRVFGGKP
ncbi:MAG: hypothetical protein ABMA13_18025, partial [Chthoniobacteraceae bacterium]